MDTHIPWFADCTGCGRKKRERLMRDFLTPIPTEVRIHLARDMVNPTLLHNLQQPGRLSQPVSPPNDEKNEASVCFRTRESAKNCWVAQQFVLGTPMPCTSALCPTMLSLFNGSSLHYIRTSERVKMQKQNKPTNPNANNIRKRVNASCQRLWHRLWQGLKPTTPVITQDQP